MVKRVKYGVYQISVLSVMVLAKVRVIVRGNVQGVGFRVWVRLFARRLGVEGLVRNVEDGAVECFLDGSRQAVHRLIDRMDVKGVLDDPLSLHVEEMEVYWEGEEGYRPAWRGYDGFEIDYNREDLRPVEREMLESLEWSKLHFTGMKQEFGGMKDVFRDELGSVRDEFGGMKQVFRDEFGGMKQVFRDEFGGMKQVFREELGSVRDEFSGMKDEFGGVKDELGSVKGEVKAVGSEIRDMHEDMNVSFEEMAERYDAISSELVRTREELIRVVDTLVQLVERLAGER